MLRALFVGIVSAGLVAASLAANASLEQWGRDRGFDYSLFAFVLVGAIAAVFQYLFRTKRNELDGLSGLHAHIHQPTIGESSLKWEARGLVSFLLSAVKGLAGPEGAAMEFCSGLTMQLRSRSARWFEHRRRTDVGSVIAGGLAAAFGAPFAAVLFSVESGVGGKVIFSAIAALSAFVTIRGLAPWLPPVFEVSGALYGLGSLGFRDWLLILACGVGGGVAGTGAVAFLRYVRSGFLSFSRRFWFPFLLGTVLLIFLGTVSAHTLFPPQEGLQALLWSRIPGHEATLLFFSKLVLLGLVIGTFGTAGVFWPVFALGGFLGVAIGTTLFDAPSGTLAWAGLIGGSAFFASVMGTPAAACVLLFEMTRNPEILFPAFVAAFSAREVSLLLRSPTLVEALLSGCGLRLLAGRSVSILQRIAVQDAMVTDHELVQEKQAVSELHPKLGDARYPFFPVIREKGTYVGMVTLDMIQEAWLTDSTVRSHSSLSKLLEVKDLLYRARFKAPVVRVSQTLAEVASVFERIPCVPVLDEEDRVVGLLFSHHVRLAYDREVARQSVAGTTGVTAPR